MTTSENWPPPATVVTGERTVLESLRVAHADELAPVLADPLLHAFIGGEPATVAELRDRFAVQVAGQSPDGSERWLNWVVRRGQDEQVVGYVQATVARVDDLLSAEVAWVIGTPYQRQGYAVEAVRAMVRWLRQHGVRSLVAHIHPDHAASQAVARAVGLAPTGDVVDGEVRWIG